MPDFDLATSPPKAKTPDTFIAYLEHVYSQRSRRPAYRALLAELRRAAVDEHRRYDMLRLVGSHIPSRANEHVIERYLDAAGLFALHASGGTERPRPSLLGQARTLGASARYANPSDKESGVDRRFANLLTRPYEDLGDELRALTRLLRSKNAPIDFAQLLHDLLAWDADSHHVQRAWARDYWTPKSNTTSTDDAST